MKKQDNRPTCPTKDLKHHRINDYLYEDSPSEDFIASVRRGGIHTALIVDKKSKIIISGHQRHKAALIVGLEEVPVDYRDGLYEDEILMMLIETNKQRPRTNEMRVREAAAMLEAESKRRLRLEREARAQAAPAPTYEQSTRQVAAAATGMSERNIEKASVVDKAIEEAEEKGDIAKAQAIKDELKKSINAARKFVAEAEAPKPKKTPAPPAAAVSTDAFNDKRPALAVISKMRAYLKQAMDLIPEVEKLHGGPSSHSRDVMKFGAKHVEKVEGWITDLK